jgi:hypothetical protein
MAITPAVHTPPSVALTPQAKGYAFAKEELPPLKRTRRAPKALTGCVSEISSCGGAGHDYAAALKNYGAVYEAYQSYLSPDATMPPHDYGRAALEADELVHDASSDDEMAQLALPIEEFSDDEIESCGYLGWLHH